MRNLRALLPLLLVVALTHGWDDARAANTDGRVNYTVQTINYDGGYDPKHIVAVWVVDGTGKFVKTLDGHAGTRIQYLRVWNANRGITNNYDGIATATLTAQPQTHAVTWDCRGTNGLLVADGNYTIRAEYTSSNAQGPVMSNVCAFVKGTSSVATNYPNYLSNLNGQFATMSLTYTPYAEIAVTNVTPSSGLIESSVPVVVTVTNQTVNPASFTVAVSNVTSTVQIGTQAVTALAGGAITNLTFNWSTVGLLANPYEVRAVASALPTETNTVNNVLTRTVTLSAPDASDIAVTRLTPVEGIVGSIIPMSVSVTNLMTYATGAFTVGISNVTAGATLIATQPVATLAGRASTNVFLAWNTVGLATGTYQVKAFAGPFSNETDTAGNTLTVPVALRAAFRDVGVDAITIAPMVPPNVVTNVTVVVTNRGDFAATFTNTLRDVSSTPILIGTRVVTDLAASAGTNLVFAWNTATNASFRLGYHTLQAGASVVADEANTGDNTNSFTVAVASGLTTNTLVATNAVWRYYDKGLDLSGAPWQTRDYIDKSWASGPAPLGYGHASIATTIGYGGVSGNRYPTTYFRHEFSMDAVPMSMTGRMSRAHGAILYLNGTEIARQNMPDGPVGFADTATSTVTGPAISFLYGFAVPTNVLVTGRNLLAAELHLASVSDSVAGIAVELTTGSPTVPVMIAIAPSALTPAGASQSGDAPSVSVTLSNAGDATTSGLVLIRDAATGQILGTLSFGPLVPGETITVLVPLSTLGAATGDRTLQAITVCNGVTNLETVATAPFTLSAPDFAPRAVPVAGSIGGRCNAVAVYGRYVYLGCGATLEIWDANVPTAPVRKGAVRLPGIVEDLAAGPNWVYAAAGAAGVQVVDVAMATQPVHRATFDSTGHARHVTLDSNLLYVADGLGGVRVLNVANPAAPTLAGAYQTVGPAQTATLASPNLIVLDGYKGMQILKASSPTALAVTGTYSLVTAGLASTAVGGAALVADANAGLYRINIAAPATPVVTATTLLPAAGRSLATSASGAALYVAAGAEGLLALDASTLVQASATSVGGEASDVAVAGNTLYVAAGFTGCRSLDISSPLSPQPLAVYATGARPVDAAAAGSKLFVAADEGGFQVHSLENLALPGLLATMASITNSRCVEVAYPYAYVGDGLYGLKILNIADAAAPTLIGNYAAPGLSHIRRIGVAGTRAVLTDGRVLQLLSVANPASPVLLATVTNAPGSFVFDVAAIGLQAYAACGNAGVRTYGLDSNLTLNSVYATPGPATAVAGASNLLHVACGPYGWLTLSLAANPAVPVLVMDSATGMAFGAAAAGPLVYLSDGARGGAALNVSAPLSPTSVANVSTLTRALRVRAVQGLMLTVEDEAGLAILNASPGDINLNGVPDDWEQQIVAASLATNGPVRSVLDVNLQAVGPNGYPYYQSYLAGLSPTDPNSVLAITALTPLAGGGQFEVQWHSVPGKRYTVLKTTDLSVEFQPIPGATGLLATTALSSYTDTVDTPNAFYMIILAP